MVRLVPPLLFVWFVLMPIFPLLYNLYHGEPIRYLPFHPGHLWFVQNLVSYSFLILPLIIWFHKQPDNFLVILGKKTVLVGFFIIMPGFLILETIVFKPQFGFAFFLTRFWYGFICFVAGFLFTCSADSFWNWIRKACHITLPIAIICFFVRKITPDWLTAYELSLIHI